MSDACKKMLYELVSGAEDICFQAFDPANYTEIDGYIKNPAFQSDETASLLSMANKALTFFTRADSEYETDTQARHSYIPTRQKKKLDKKGDVAFPAFSMVPFQAFKHDRADFEDAVRGCCDNILATEEERTGFGDAEILDSTFRDEFFDNRGPFQVKTGRIYQRQNLLGVFALWKIDRAILAIQNNMAADVANLLTDAQEALRIADECYQREIQALSLKKEVSERQASAGKESHNSLNDIKERVLSIYFVEGKIEKWRSVRKASDVLFNRLDDEDKKRFVSPEGAKNTIWEWITDADPKGEFSRYKKKSSG